jgi:hypothetical protein
MSEYDQPGTSQVSILGIDVSGLGYNATSWSTSSSADSTTGYLDVSAMNGFISWPLAPDALLLKTSVTCNASGCSINGGSRSGFPSLEAWGYQVGQAPTMIFNVPEGTSGQLGNFNANVPKGYYGGGGSSSGGYWAYTSGVFIPGFYGSAESPGENGVWIGFYGPTIPGPRFIK